MKATKGGYNIKILDVWKVNRHGEVSVEGFLQAPSLNSYPTKCWTLKCWDSQTELLYGAIRAGRYGGALAEILMLNVSGET